MDGPYREPPRSPSLQASIRQGTARLEVAPGQTLLEITNRLSVSVNESWLTVITGDANQRRRALSLHLARSVVLVSRAFPTGEPALWYEKAPGMFDRVIGLEPVPPLDTEALNAARQLDRLGERLATALAPHAGGAREAIEFGQGKHRVLLVVKPGRMIVYARPLFRELVRRTLEVCADGTILVPRRKGDLKLSCTSRFGVIVRGDWICFDSNRTSERTAVWLPWIGPDDRTELAALLGSMVEPPASAERSAG